MEVTSFIAAVTKSITQLKQSVADQWPPLRTGYMVSIWHWACKRGSHAVHSFYATHARRLPLQSLLTGFQLQLSLLLTSDVPFLDQHRQRAINWILQHDTAATESTTNWPDLCLLSCSSKLCSRGRFLA